MANENQKATVKSFVALMKFASQHAGLVAQSYRVYNGSGGAASKNQTSVVSSVSNSASITQPDLSKFENGDKIPDGTALPHVLREYGFESNLGSGGEAFQKFLEWHRDYFTPLAKLIDEEPK